MDRHDVGLTRIHAEFGEYRHQGLAEGVKVDKETLQRAEPTFPLTWLRTASATDDGSRLVITMDSRDGVVVVDGRSGDLLAEIVANSAFGTTTPKSAVVAPGGTIIAADFQGGVTIYDSETFEVLHALSGTRGDTEIQVSADGSLALARGGDHSVTLYDVATGEQLGDRLTTLDTEVVASAMRPDGKEVAIGGGFDDGILLWDLDPQHWVAAVCELADRNLTQAEWDTYIGDLATYHDTCPDIGNRGSMSMMVYIWVDISRPADPHGRN